MPFAIKHYISQVGYVITTLRLKEKGHLLVAGHYNVLHPRHYRYSSYLG